MSRHRFLIKFSWRNLGRHPFRTLIMALGLCFATGYIIFALNFSTSGSKEIISDFLSQYFGNHQIVAPGYYPDKNSKKSFNANYTLSENDVAGLPLENYVRRVTLPIFLSGPRKTLGTLLSGLAPTHELKHSNVKKSLSQGRFLTDDGVNELLLGERLARKLGVKLGDEVAVIGQAIDGSVANDMFRVVGMLNFGGGDMEENLAFTNIASARTLAVIPENRFHQLVSFAEFGSPFPQPPQGTELVRWSTLLPEMAGSVQFIDTFTWIVAIIIVVVISLGMGNTLMITFLERQKEFYSLNVIGARSSWIAVALAIEVLMLGFLGIGAGVALGNAITAFFNVHPISLMIFTGGKPLMMGGVAVIPKIRLHAHHAYSWQAPLLVFFFLTLSLIFPIQRIIQRSRRAD